MSCILVDGSTLRPKIGYIEVSTNESLSVDNASHSCLQSRSPLILKYILGARTESTSLHMLKNSMMVLSDKVCCCTHVKENSVVVRISVVAINTIKTLWKLHITDFFPHIWIHHEAH